LLATCAAEVGRGVASLGPSCTALALLTGPEQPASTNPTLASLIIGDPLISVSAPLSTLVRRHDPVIYPTAAADSAPRSMRCARLSYGLTACILLTALTTIPTARSLPVVFELQAAWLGQHKRISSAFLSAHLA
jgi:hypothetical protein